MRLIDADVLYEKLKADEELARDRVIDTPNSFPNGAVNPSAIRYMAQLNERTRFKEMVFDAPTIEAHERRTGKWIDKGGYLECSQCGGLAPTIEFADGTLWKESSFCPDCGAKMKENKMNNDLISRKAVRQKLTALVNEFEEILSRIRESNGDDSVCGLCEYDGAYIGQSGDWCNECPGFDRDDCFKLKEKYREEWLKIDG